MFLFHVLWAFASVAVIPSGNLKRKMSLFVLACVLSQWNAGMVLSAVNLTAKSGLENNGLHVGFWGFSWHFGKTNYRKLLCACMLFLAILLLCLDLELKAKFGSLFTFSLCGAEEII